LCKICSRKREADEHNRPLTKDEQEKYDALIALERAQRMAQQAQRSALAADELFVVFDFSTIQETASFKLKILSFAVWGLLPGDWLYIDIAGECSADWRFFFYGISILFPYLKRAKQGLHRLRLWSDGGLKTNLNIWALCQIQVSSSNLLLFLNGFLLIMSKQLAHEINVESNFYAPMHGHSVCDGHFGSIKRRLRSIRIGKTVAAIQDVVDAATRFVHIFLTITSF
jgi:hypothetical protein